MTRKSLEPWLKDEIVFRDYQEEGIRWIAQRRSCIIADEMGLGKAESLDSPILTPSGWTRMGDVKVGMDIIGSAGHAIKVTGVFPRGVMDTYRVTFSDGSSELFSADHLFAVNSAGRKHRGTGNLVKSVRELMDGGLKDKAGNRKWYIPMVKPVVFAENDEHILDPYFVGVLLGDGSLGAGHCSLTTDRDIIESLNLPTGASFSYRERIYDAEYVAVVGFSGMMPHLRSVGMNGHNADSKSIPHRYKWASDPADRIAVLQGLLDTDGTTVNSRGRASTSIEYGTVSKQLAEDVKFIVQSLGGTVSIQEKTPTYRYKGEDLEGALFYRMVLHLPSGITPFRLARKAEKWVPRSKYEPTRGIESIELEGEAEVQCISVDADDRLYVTTDFIVTHNTLQALTAACIDVKHFGAEKIVIVTPPSLKGNWAFELDKFTRLPYVVLKGSPNKRFKTLFEFEDMAGPKVLIVNYEQTLAHIPQMYKMGWDIGIYDEAHYMKSVTAQRTIANVDMPTKRSFLLTGTPMLNNVGELWPLLYKCDEKEWGSQAAFLDRYASYGGYGGNQITGVMNEDELQARIAPYFLRRLSDDVLNLKEPQVIDRFADMTDKQAKLYKRIVDEAILPWADGTEEDIENAMSKFLRLRQAANTTAPFLEKEESGKLDLSTSDAIEIMAQGHKVVQFTQFNDTYDATVLRLKKAGAPVYELHAGVKAEDRAAVVKRWSDHQGAAVLVCKSQIAGVGLNMTAARHMQLIDKLFTPGINDQIIARLNRIGQDETQPVQVLQYFSIGSVEARVQQILNHKEHVIGKVIKTSAELNEVMIEALREEGVQFAE